MTRSEQESPVLVTSTPGLMRRGLETGPLVPRQSSTLLTRRGLETGPWRTYTGTELETADTAKGSLPIPRQSSTLPNGRGLETGALCTAPALDPTRGKAKFRRDK